MVAGVWYERDQHLGENPHERPAYGKYGGAMNATILDRIKESLADQPSTFLFPIVK